MIDNATIFNIQRYSLHDGGGIRSIVFFKGCPFTCPWCCNPESLSIEPQLFYKDILCMHCSEKVAGTCKKEAKDCPTGAKEIIGYKQSVDEIYDIIKRDYTFYETSNGGITLSGGEVLLQLPFALKLLKKCKENDIHTAMETTLAVPICDIEKLVSLTDLFLVDFKIWDPLKSKTILHLDLDIVKKNIDSILRNKGKIIARIPLIPTYSDTKENLMNIIHYLIQKKIKEVHLLPFHQLGEAKYKSIQKEYLCSNLKPLSDAQIKEIDSLFKNNGFKTIIHGN